MSTYQYTISFTLNLAEITMPTPSEYNKVKIADAKEHADGVESNAMCINYGELSPSQRQYVVALVNQLEYTLQGIKRLLAT